GDNCRDHDCNAIVEMQRYDETEHQIGRDNEDNQKNAKPTEFRRYRRGRLFVTPFRSWLHTVRYEALLAFPVKSGFMDNSSSPKAPEIVTSTPIFSGRVFSVRQEVVRFSDGREATLDVIAHRGSFGILAFVSPHEIVLVRQYRHAVGEWLWEIPAGTAEPGEAAGEGARRELAEETGYRCERIRQLGHSFYVTPGYCNERLSLFLAEGLTPGEQ